jgi:hypothetical protein
MSENLRDSKFSIVLTKNYRQSACCVKERALEEIKRTHKTP